MEIKIKIIHELVNEEVTVKKGTSITDICKKYEGRFKHPIVLAAVDRDLRDLCFNLQQDSVVELLDITNPNGFRAYQRSIFFLLICAVKEVMGEKTRLDIGHSISKNYYCELPGDNEKVTNEVFEQIKAEMQKMVDENKPFEKVTIPLEEGVTLSHKFGMLDKVELLKFRRTSKINFYKLDKYYDYFYGNMVPNTGCLSNFKLHRSSVGFVLQFPRQDKPEELSELKELVKMFPVFAESKRWAKILNVHTVGALNNAMSNGEFADIVRISEALHEKKIAEIADKIANNNKTIVLIAGPSSSGKTTFANRLFIQLRVNGLMPHVVSMDNYFKPASEAVLDKNGNPDYESVTHVNLDLLNSDLERLLKGEAVHMPVYNFITGQPEYRGDFLTLKENGVLIIEGIHGLNNMVADNIPADCKLKIFISALTQLNVDEHNRIPTTDTRLIRRIVRDNQFRGYSAARTIAAWPSVMHGEVKNIFPFQEEADAVFNSALVYEMSVLKQYVEPLLFEINSSMPQYTEARRLVKFLDSFLGTSSEQIPKNSILREFIGGSCFKT